MIIKSGFAILDVTHGRKGLFRHFMRFPWGRPEPKPIKVVIEAEIIDFYGDDDGISREFELSVKKVHVVE